MDARLATIQSMPCEYDVLKMLYGEYASPKDKIARLAAEGQLVRLKKGLYAVGPGQAARSVLLGLIANRLYGPSYVSLETALYLYQMIPERVFEIRSLTTKRSRLFENGLGRFRYYQVAAQYLCVGADIYQDVGGNYLMARPEKALCDMIAVARNLRIQSAGAMRVFMEEDLRIDLEQTPTMEAAIFDAVIATGTKRREMRLLKEYCNNACDLI